MSAFDPRTLAVPGEPFEAHVNGVRYAGTDSGGSGAAVLLLHGWPDDRALWQHQTRALAERGYRVIALDWIGHGESERVRDRRRFGADVLSADLDALLALRDVTAAHVIAHDYGAVIAWTFVTDYPQRVLTYCTLSIGHPAAILKNPSLESLRKNWFLVYNALPFAVAGYRWRDATFFRWAMRQHPDRDKVVARFLADPDPFYIQAWELGNPAHALASKLMFKPIRRIPKVRAPTLGIWGSLDDFAAEAQMKRSAAFVDNTFEYVRLDDLGHWLQLEAPERVTPLLVNWLQRHADQGPSA